MKDLSLGWESGSSCRSYQPHLNRRSAISILATQGVSDLSKADQTVLRRIDRLTSLLGKEDEVHSPRRCDIEITGRGGDCFNFAAKDCGRSEAIYHLATEGIDGLSEDDVGRLNAIRDIAGQIGSDDPPEQESPNEVTEDVGMIQIGSDYVSRELWGEMMDCGISRVTVWNDGISLSLVSPLLSFGNRMTFRSLDPVNDASAIAYLIDHGVDP